MSYCFWGLRHESGLVTEMSFFLFYLHLIETFSLGFQRDQTKESVYFGTQQHFPTSVQPAETPGISPELCGAVITSGWQVKGVHAPPAGSALYGSRWEVRPVARPALPGRGLLESKCLLSSVGL